MIYICIIILIIAIILFVIGIKNINNTHKINSDVDEKNRILQQEIYELKSSYDKVRHEIEYANQELENNEKEIEKKKTELKNLNVLIEETSESKRVLLENQETTTRKAFENYCDVLDAEYQKKEEEYNLLCEKLTKAYDDKQKNLIAGIAQYSDELEKIRATREAVLTAARKEEEIKDNLSFYCLPIDPIDKLDLDVLESVKLRLAKPRILSMLIWQTYFQKPMTTLCNNVLGTKKVTGIYKITNTIDNHCYIGQAVDVADRWKTHAKHGLDIDTPAGNKLYAAMIKDGITNFSWELLEECPMDQLDEKEVFYINLYQSKDYGYNSNRGNKKSS